MGVLTVRGGEGALWAAAGTKAESRQTGVILSDQGCGRGKPGLVGATLVTVLPQFGRSLLLEACLYHSIWH